MIKKITLLLCISSFLAATANDKDKKPITLEDVMIVGAATTATVIVGLGIGAAMTALAPVILPASTIVAMKTAVTAVAVKATATGVAIKTTATVAAIKASSAVVVAAPYATKISLGISAVQMAKPFVLPTPEDELNNILKVKASRLHKAEKELTACLTQNKFTFGKVAVNPPPTCEHQARVFELMSGKKVFNH